MHKEQGQVLQWGRRVGGYLDEYDVKSEFAELTPLRKELDDAVAQLTVNAADQDAITKQARVQTTEIEQLRYALREVHLKSIVRMSRTMQFPEGSKITFVLPRKNVNDERLAAAGDAMVTALKVVGQQFIDHGFASNFVEQLSTATKALRDAIDVRSKQVSRRAGTTAAIADVAGRVVQVVRVIDSLVRPVIQTDPERLAAWENVVALPRRWAGAGTVVSTPVTSTTPAMPPAVIGVTGQGQQAAA